MRRSTTIAALCGFALAAAVTAVTPGRPTAPELDPSAPQATANSVWDVLYARPFRLDEPYTHNWRAERPSVTTGHLLVLAVDPASVVPRQALEPVLQVGEQTAERVNRGHFDGALVVIVPSAPSDDGGPSLELNHAAIFLGTPALPEEVDAAHLEAELAGTSVTPFAASRVTSALARGGAILELPDRVALIQEAARLVLGYAPSEQDLADGLLVPYVR